MSSFNKSHKCVNTAGPSEQQVLLTIQLTELKRLSSETEIADIPRMVLASDIAVEYNKWPLINRKN